MGLNPPAVFNRQGTDQPSMRRPINDTRSPDPPTEQLSYQNKEGSASQMVIADS